MAEAITGLIDLQKQINEIEIDFDVRRALLDHKHESVLKSAYEQRTKIILGLNGDKESPYGQKSITSHDENYSRISNTSLSICNNANNSSYTFNGNNSSNVHSSSWVDGGASNRTNQKRPLLEGFWYTIFMNSKQLCDRIEEHDKDALMYLVNVSSGTDVSRLKTEKTYSFVLEFYFASNPYFHNQLLTKEYFVEVKTDKENPLQYFGPRIYRSVGCNINWKQGMDLTKKHPIRPPRLGSVGGETTSPSVSPGDVNRKEFRVKEWIIAGGRSTFFNFFTFPQLPENITLDEIDEALVDKDFQLGWHIKDEIIPQALFYFLGDISDSESEASSDDTLSSNDSSSDSSSSRSSNRSNSHSTHGTHKHNRKRADDRRRR